MLQLLPTRLFDWEEDEEVRRKRSLRLEWLSEFLLALPDHPNFRGVTIHSSRLLPAKSPTWPEAECEN